MILIFAAIIYFEKKTYLLISCRKNALNDTSLAKNTYQLGELDFHLQLWKRCERII